MTTKKKLISEADRNALVRAVKWVERYQRGYPEITMLPSPMPPEGSPRWIAEAQRCASIAQSRTLGLPPWEPDPLRALEAAGRPLARTD